MLALPASLQPAFPSFERAVARCTSEQYQHLLLQFGDIMRLLHTNACACILKEGVSRAHRTEQHMMRPPHTRRRQRRRKLQHPVQRRNLPHIMHTRLPLAAPAHEPPQCGLGACSCVRRTQKVSQVAAKGDGVARERVDDDSSGCRFERVDVVERKHGGACMHAVAHPAPAWPRYAVHL
jgi:hypothetical protein